MVLEKILIWLRKTCQLHCLDEKLRVGDSIFLVCGKLTMFVDFDTQNFIKVYQSSHFYTGINCQQST